MGLGRRFSSGRSALRPHVGRSGDYCGAPQADTRSMNCSGLFCVGKRWDAQRGSGRLVTGDISLHRKWRKENVGVRIWITYVGQLAKDA